MTQVEDLIYRVAQALVDHPEQVLVKVIKDEAMSIFELRVAKVDLGKIIGKQGRTADSIRTIVSAAAGKTRKRFRLEIIE